MYTYESFPSAFQKNRLLLPCRVLFVLQGKNENSAGWNCIIVHIDITITTIVKYPKICYSHKPIKRLTKRQDASSGQTLYFQTLYML